MNEYASAILAMTVSQFRQFKKALRTLQATGIYRDDAIRILMEQHLSNGGKLRKVS